jgi:diguanylate cyclase (GGDEF)-like protein/PAS domain S-box-containing protein
MNRYHLSVRGDHAGLWDWNLATNRVHFSPRWISMVGSDEHSLGDTPDAWLRRVHPDDVDEVRRRIDEHLAGGACEFDLPHRLLHRDGTYRWMSCHGAVVRNESGRAVRVMGCHSDVTAEKVADALTGLPNRLLFMDHLARAIERAKRNPTHHFAVLLVDLGRTAPHQDEAVANAPDPVLTAAARRLETCLRAGDGSASLSRNHLVARLRGDEFAILLDGLAEIGDARVVADRVLGEILASFMVGGGEVYLSASIGIALSATGYTLAESVMRDADTALHRARLLGGTRCEVFDTAILRSAQTELQLDTDFMQALARGEFVLFFQPVVSLATNRVAGFEALVRWQHPTRGLISPAEFIPIAEKTGFIVQLGEWTLREACLQLKAWQETLVSAENMWVSVNLSTPQFTHPSLVDDIAGTLRDAGLPARCLVLELTEGVAMENPAAVKGLLMQLRAMGARIALDDFGTGQSSLAYLHQFPADKLKLDQSFVRDMESRNDVRDIVAAVTALAHQLGLEVIAEGVETAGQLALVRSLECEYVQGFVFSKPVDRDRAAELLRAGVLPSPDIGRAVSPNTARRERGPAPGTARRMPRLTRALYVSAAAGITLALAGLVARFAAPQPPSPGPPVSQAALAPTAAAPGPAAVRSMAAPTPTDFKAGSAPGPGRATAGAPPATPARSAAMPVAYSFAVVHKHTLRGCRGQLAVSSGGVAFVPDRNEDKSKDAFRFKYSEFSSAVSGDELTIQAGTRTFRFKAAGVSGKDEGRARLQEIAHRISRLRPARPAK